MDLENIFVTRILDPMEKTKSYNQVMLQYRYN